MISDLTRWNLILGLSTTMCFFGCNQSGDSALASSDPGMTKGKAGDQLQFGDPGSAGKGPLVIGEGEAPLALAKTAAVDLPELGDSFPFLGGSWGSASFLPADLSQANPGVKGQISTATDKDYYVVKAPNGNGCKVYFDVQIYGTPDLDIRVLDMSGNLVAGSYSVTNYERVVLFPAINGGVYVLEVYGYQGATGSYLPMTFYELCN